MELQEIDPPGLQTIQAALDAGPHHLRRHLTRCRAPFGEDRGRLEAPLHDAFLEAPGDVFGAAVMIGHVEAVEARRGIFTERRRRAIEIDRLPAPLHIRHLPEAGDHAADGEAGREFDAVWGVCFYHVK